MVLIYDGARDDHDPRLLCERLCDLRLELSVHLRDVIDNLEASVVEWLNGFFEKLALAPLLVEVKRSFDFLHVVLVLKLRVLRLKLWLVEQVTDIDLRSMHAFLLHLRNARATLDRMTAHSRSKVARFVQLFDLAQVLPPAVSFNRL